MPVLWRDDEDLPHLEGHVALVDPVADGIRAGGQLTVVFPGPTSYVSPEWYGSPGLPTYCFAPVHVTGVPQVMEEEELRSHLIDLIDDHERRHTPQPHTEWTVQGENEDRMDKLMPAILGYRLSVEDIEIKVKAGQNRPEPDDVCTVEHLRDGTPDQQEISEFIQRYSITLKKNG